MVGAYARGYGFAGLFGEGLGVIPLGSILYCTAVLSSIHIQCSDVLNAPSLRGLGFSDAALCAGVQPLHSISVAEDRSKMEEQRSAEGFAGSLLSGLGFGPGPAVGLSALDSAALNPTLAAQLAAVGLPTFSRPAQPALDPQALLLQLLQQQQAVAPLAGHPLLSLLNQVRFEAPIRN